MSHNRQCVDKFHRSKGYSGPFSSWLINGEGEAYEIPSISFEIIHLIDLEDTKRALSNKYLAGLHNWMNSHERVESLANEMYNFAKASKWDIMIVRSDEYCCPKGFHSVGTYHKLPSWSDKELGIAWMKAYNKNHGTSY